MHFDLSQRAIVGSVGQLPVHHDDEITARLFMLAEGQCDGLGAAQAAEKFGVSRQRYYQLLKRFKEHGPIALQLQKRGPKTNYVRNDEVVRQVIRHRFLDPDASTAVIAQKLQQAGFPISSRSVDRVVEDFGLQKKTLSLSAQPRAADSHSGQ